MESKYAVGLSKKAIDIYKLLINSQPLTVKEIGESLGILPHGVYRLMEHLQIYGLVEKYKDNPLRYRAINANEARENYLMQQRIWFSNVINDKVSDVLQRREIKEKQFDLSFLPNRDEHVRQFTNKINSAKFSIKYIILALPIGVPSETMLAHMQAIKRGVEIKLLVLEHTKENHNILMSYKHMGVQVRHGDFLNWHLFLVDDDFSSIEMYDPENKVMQTGVNLIHTGINRELQGIFDKYWREALPV